MGRCFPACFLFFICNQAFTYAELKEANSTAKNLTDISCELSNKTVSVDDVVKNVHCLLGQQYLNDIRKHILDEIFDVASPPTSVSLLSAELVRNLTDSYYRDLSLNNSQYRTNFADDAAYRIVRQRQIDANTIAKPSESFYEKARLQRKILGAQADPPHLVQDYYRTYFHLHNMTEYTVLNATLYFYLERPLADRQLPGDYKYQVHVYKYIKETEVDDSVYEETHKNLPTNGKWDSVNLTSLVAEWVATPWKNYGILIRAEHITSSPTDDEPHALLIGRHNEQRNKTNMFLEIEVRSQVLQEETAESRLPLPNDCSLDPPQYKNQCCRFPLKVDFENFGWDWIVAPKRYDAFYCAGGCEVLGSLTHNGHSVLTQQMEAIFKANGRDNHRRHVGPCCSPQDMQEMNVIFVDHAGNIRNRRIPNMIVHRCGCH